jgi:uncharacterized OB-fold protein
MDFPTPVVDPVSEPYFTALAEGRLALQHCEECDAFLHYPRVVCTECLSESLTWVTASGLGQLQSFAEVHKPQHPSFNVEVPILFAAIHIDEGPVIFGRLLAAASVVAVGTRVELDIEAVRARPSLPSFRISRPSIVPGFP